MAILLNAKPNLILKHIFKHQLLTDVKNDKLIYEEKDDIYNTTVYKTKSDKYLIIAGVSGRGGLFGGADEYWGLVNANACSDVSNAIGWEVRSDKLDYVERQLNKYVETFSGLESFYKFGFKSKFFEEFILGCFDDFEVTGVVNMVFDSSVR